MKAVIVYSGGMDSTVLLYELRKMKHETHALSFHYGQRHAKELNCAKAICFDLGISHKTVDLSSLADLLGGSCLTDTAIAVPEGHYAEESMKATVVPNRNMIMLAIAAGHAMSIKADYVAYAAHAGDHAIYPDCRKAFSDSLQHTIGLADWHKVRLARPYIEMSKTDIAKRGFLAGVPFERTWSCYKGGEKHCGKCGTCIERKEAFQQAGLIDRTEYE